MRLINALLRKRETVVLDWCDFNAQLNALSVSQFQQRTRNESARNASKRTISDAERTHNASVRQQIKRQQDSKTQLY